MILRMKKRLESIEDDLIPDPSKNKIVFTPFEDESDEEYDNRIARWKDGEAVDGVRKPFAGNEDNYIVVRFVSPNGPTEAQNS